MELNSLIDKCIKSGNLSRDEIIFFLSLDKEEDIDKLLKAGNDVFKTYCGDEVHIRALVEFSNICARHCNYCGLRASNKKVIRYRMTPQEIIEVALLVNSKGLKTIVLQSGEDSYYTGDIIAGIVREIKSKTDMAVTLCVGERSYEDYKLWKEAGADRYLLRHETADCEHYKLLHPDSDFHNRVKCLRQLRELGYQVGAGCMVGSPEQTAEHLANDIEFIKDFQPDMVGIGPFIPHPQTPFAGYETGSLKMTLKMVALVRIVTRNALIPATTAIGSIEEFGREMALMAGADVVMPNFTPIKYREHYEIYPNKRCIHEDSSHCLSCIRARIQAIGRKVSCGHGHSRKG